MAEEPNENSPERLYDWPFLVLFVALLFFMGGSTMLVHLRKYLALGGGDVGTVSMVFGIGMIGSILMRPFVGSSIDRIGCNRILRLACMVGAITTLGYLISSNLILVCSLRILFQLAQATFLATIAVAAARISPPTRTAESLAMIGMGGLLGLMLGPIIGDEIFSFYANSEARFTIYFGTAAAIMFASLACASCVRVPEIIQSVDARENFFRVVMQHKPGPIVIMAVCLALVQTVPIMFIEPFVNERNLGGVTAFFLAYSPTAIVLRIILRPLPVRIGRRRTLIMGMIAYPIGLLLLTRVHTAAGLILPGIVMGFGHCFTYPFLVDLSADSMPPQYRGVATSLILGVLDLGFLTGFLMMGYISKTFNFNVSFCTIAIIAIVGVSAYAWTQRKLFQPLRTNV